MDRKEIVGKNLTRILQERDLSQIELARRINSTSASVSGWCNGVFMPRMDKIKAICKLLHIDESDILLSDEERLPSNILRPNARQIPIIGEICAGTGIAIEERYEGNVIVDKSIKADFALRIKGDSMRDAGIENGDLVYIEKLSNFKEGDVYAIGIKGEEEAVVRRVYIQDNKYILTPANPVYTPKFCDLSEVFIIGRVMGLYREVGQI